MLTMSRSSSRTTLIEAPCPGFTGKQTADMEPYAIWKDTTGSRPAVEPKLDLNAYFAFNNLWFEHFGDVTIVAMLFNHSVQQTKNVLFLHGKENPGIAHDLRYALKLFTDMILCAAAFVHALPRANLYALIEIVLSVLHECMIRLSAAALVYGVRRTTKRWPHIRHDGHYPVTPDPEIDAHGNSTRFLAFRVSMANSAVREVIQRAQAAGYHEQAAFLFINNYWIRHCDRKQEQNSARGLTALVYACINGCMHSGFYEIDMVEQTCHMASLRAFLRAVTRGAGQDQDQDTDKDAVHADYYKKLLDGYVARAVDEDDARKAAEMVRAVRVGDKDADKAVAKTPSKAVAEAAVVQKAKEGKEAKEDKEAKEGKEAEMAEMAAVAAVTAVTAVSLVKPEKKCLYRRIIAAIKG